MQNFASFDWDTGTEQDHAKMVRSGTTTQWRALARTYDWGQHPVAVLGWIMAQKEIDLGTAVSVFLNAKPLDYNYISKDEVPFEQRGICRLLDIICLRINCGFYLPLQGSGVNMAEKARVWIQYQQDDNAEGRAGRWVLDSCFVDLALKSEISVKRRLPIDGPLTTAGFFASLVKPFYDPQSNERFRLRA